MRLDIDNSKTKTVLILKLVDIRDYVQKSAPVDVCGMCYARHKFTDDVEHPPYSDDVYKCAICRTRLTDSDA